MQAERVCGTSSEYFALPVFCHTTSCQVRNIAYATNNAQPEKSLN